MGHSKSPSAPKQANSILSFFGKQGSVTKASSASPSSPTILTPPLENKTLQRTGSRITAPTPPHASGDTPQTRTGDTVFIRNLNTRGKVVRVIRNHEGDKVAFVLADNGKEVEGSCSFGVDFDHVPCQETTSGTEGPVKVAATPQTREPSESEKQPTCEEKSKKSSLTEEQRKRIEENRQKALQKLNAKKGTVSGQTKLNFFGAGVSAAVPATTESEKPSVRSPLAKKEPATVSSAEKAAPKKENIDPEPKVSRAVEDEDDGPVVGRRKRRRINYVESDDEDDDVKPRGGSGKGCRRVKRIDDDDEEYNAEQEASEESEDEDDDEPSDDDECDIEALKRKARGSPEPKPKGAKRAKQVKPAQRNKPSKESTPELVENPTPIVRRPAPAVVPGEINETMDSFRAGKDPVEATNVNTHNSNAKQVAKTMFNDKEEAKREKEAKFQEKNKDRYEWLVDIRDAEKRRPDNPDYDKRTLYVPPAAFAKLSPFEKQFWEIKAKHFDTVIFFRKGKFFELYENDADVGHQELGLKLTDRVNMRMAGVPVPNFEMWTSKLLGLGYKVGKVEETMTRAQMDKAGKSGIVKRELVQILTQSTIVDVDMIQADQSSYCIAIKEEPLQSPTTSSAVKYGVCVVEPSTGEIYLGEFEDDSQRTLFQTMIVQLQPREILHEKSQLSRESTRIIVNNASSAAVTAIKPGAEFWAKDTTVDELRYSEYFCSSREDVGSSGWPKVLSEVIASDQDCALSALGACVWYLRDCMIDKDVISIGNFHHYHELSRSSRYLHMDGQTLVNLDILQNSFTGDTQGTLLKHLDQCSTSFGRRLFRKWICHPLRDAPAINERLDAIEELSGEAVVVEHMLGTFRRIPDIERLLSRIHAGAARIVDLMKVEEGLNALVQALDLVANELEGGQFKSSLLCKHFKAASDHVVSRLEHFSKAYDHHLAKENGLLIPQPGIVPEYDDIMDTINGAEKELASYLQEQKSVLKCSKIAFKDIQKEPWQIEVPEGVKVPNEYQKMSQAKGVKRYWTSFIKTRVSTLDDAKLERESVRSVVLKKLLADFDVDYKAWMDLTQRFAEIDCLISLSRTCSRGDGPMCRPQFVTSQNSKPVLDVKGLRHPMAAQTTDFIANDTVLGGADSPVAMILTGPNMGGKSTLLRQNCIAVIMAQLGCYVPAESCRLSPVDRIFTRIGANDRILAGQSTFMVELAETSNILRYATNESLVILDELGRGTSTFDGYAIAHSVLSHIVRDIGCRTMFATHYHMLAEEFESQSDLVGNGHMACLLEDNKRDVIFLYKLQSGICPKSYGLNVARLAGFPEEVLDKAQLAAENFENNEKSLSTYARKRCHNATQGLPDTERETFKVLYYELLDTTRIGSNLSLDVIKSWQDKLNGMA